MASNLICNGWAGILVEGLQLNAVYCDQSGVRSGQGFVEATARKPLVTQGARLHTIYTIIYIFIYVYNMSLIMIIHDYIYI